MKKILIIVLVFIGTLGVGQESTFSLGLTYQPFFYKNYNKADWNNMPSSFPDNPSRFNGYAVGLTSGRLLSENLELAAEVLFSDQTQHHTLIAEIHQDNDGDIIEYIYGNTITINFDQIRLPLLLKYTKEIGYNSKLFISTYGGIQLSYLMDYRSKHIKYGRIIDGMGEVDLDSIRAITIQSPGKVYQRIWDYYPEPGHWREMTIDQEDVYTKFLYGVVGGIEITKRINDIVEVSLGGRYDYDLTNSEKHQELILPPLQRNRRPKSHHTRIGLTLSVAYIFE